MMPTSTGQQRKMRRVGTLEFTLKGQPMKLTAFVEVGARLNRLFVPFSDLTSGTETYPAGRYIDLDRTATGALRDRLQPRLQPVLLLQPRVRLSAPAAGEPAEGADPRRREDSPRRQVVSVATCNRAVVFDFDGVIANSEPLHFLGFRDVLAEEGVELSEADYYARYLGYDDAGAFWRWRPTAA